MKKVVLLLLLILSFSVVVYAKNMNLVDQIIFDANYEMSRGYNSGIDHCYDLLWNHTYYHKYIKVLSVPITQRVEMFIVERCKLGAWKSTHVGFNYPTYSILHTRDIVEQILHKQKYGDKAKIRGYLQLH